MRVLSRQHLRQYKTLRVVKELVENGVYWVISPFYLVYVFLMICYLYLKDRGENDLYDPTETGWDQS